LARHEPGEVSGYDVVRAAKRARELQGSAPPPPPRPPLAPPAQPPDQPEPEKSKARIGKTALPNKYEYTCYQCGYEFTVAGRVHTLYCAKCRTILNQANYTIDKRHDVSIVTAGSVTITPEGIWAGGTLTAREVVLEGKLEAGSIKATARLEIGPNADADWSKLEARDLALREGTTVTWEVPRVFRHVELAGQLEGALECTGSVTIRASGCLRGKVKAPRMKVEDGGGLLADVIVSSETENAKSRQA